MGDVTGPISTLPGRSHELPAGSTCDQHPDRPAVARIQGETDSFGCEMLDWCEECLAKYREEMASDEPDGFCDWCRTDAKLRPTRDFEEGVCGPVYYVCEPCYGRQQKAIQDEVNSWDDPPEYDDYDDYEIECYECGGEGYVHDCIDGFCVDADFGCDMCTRRCDMCNSAKKGGAA